VTLRPDWRSPVTDTSYRLAIHGLAIELSCDVAGLRPALDHAFGEFSVPGFPQGFTPITGSIRNFDQAEVLKCLSPTARRIRQNDCLELYEENERFWIVDETWGMCEINLLKSSWRTWILPATATDSIRCTDASVLWPLAQLLRPRGLHLVPAVSVSRGGKSLLILSPFGIEPELVSLIDAGFRVIGQSWTAVREEKDKIELLHMPGHVHRPVAPRLRAGGDQTPQWVDLMQEFAGAEQRYGFCDAVIVVEPGRRPSAHCNVMDPARSTAVLKSAWPIAELHPQRRPGQLATRLAQRCVCLEVGLSRDPNQFLETLTRTIIGMSRPSNIAGSGTAPAPSGFPTPSPRLASIAV
jgi:hypothetical protein